jgi:hypothetical protein
VLADDLVRAALAREDAALRDRQRGRTRTVPSPSGRAELYEREIEDLAWANPEEITGEALFLVRRQPHLRDGGRPVRRSQAHSAESLSPNDWNIRLALAAQAPSSEYAEAV